MRNSRKMKSLAERTPFAKTLLAASLSVSLAAFGCTTNHMRGDGEPATGGPGVNNVAPTAGTANGTSSGSVVPPPMTSASTYFEAMPRVTARQSVQVASSSFAGTSRGVVAPSNGFAGTSGLSRADRAAAIMAGHQGLSGRYLGTVNPGSSGRGYLSDSNTGRGINPALLTNPQITVNSSISSPATPAIVNSGGGADGGAIIGAVTADGAIISNGVSGATAGGISSGITSSQVSPATGTVATGVNSVTNAGNAATFTTNTFPLTPTTAALPVSPGVFAAGPGTAAGVAAPVAGGTTTVASTGTLTPTASSSLVTPVTAATSGLPAFAASGFGTGTTTTAASSGTAVSSAVTNAGVTSGITANTTATTANTTATTGTTTRSARARVSTSSRASGRITAPVRVTSTNGRTVITNNNRPQQ